MLKLKALKYVGIAVMVIGFLLALGTAGASDLNTIGWAQIVRQLLISAAMMVVGGFVSYAIEDYMEEVDYND